MIKENKFNYEKSLSAVNKKSNFIIENYIKDKINFNDLTKAQFSTLEDMLEQRKFNLIDSNAKDILEFINEKIKKDKSKKFFKDIKENYIEKAEDILKEVSCGNESTEIKNNVFREVFYLIKIYYRKELAVKKLKEAGNEF